MTVHQARRLLLAAPAAALLAALLGAYGPTAYFQLACLYEGGTTYSLDGVATCTTDHAIWHEGMNR